MYTGRWKVVKLGSCSPPPCVVSLCTCVRVWIFTAAAVFARGNYPLPAERRKVSRLFIGGTRRPSEEDFLPFSFCDFSCKFCDDCQCAYSALRDAFSCGNSFRVLFMRLMLRLKFYSKPTAILCSFFQSIPIDDQNFLRSVIDGHKDLLKSVQNRPFNVQMYLCCCLISKLNFSVCFQTH